MNKTALTFLKDLMAAPTPSGWEDAGQNVVADYMGRYADSVTSDVHGNVHAVLNPDAPVRVMLAGHCDEIGLMIQHIDDKGFLYMTAIGGVNVPLLQGERILVHASRGIVPGVVGVKPVHLMDPKERGKTATQLHDLWVDIGASSRRDAERAVAIGDVATVDAGWRELRNGRVASRGFDDRIGAFVVAEALRRVSRKKLNVAVHVVSTVQEEVGLRGARTAAFKVDPHVGIACDVGFSSDYPGMDEKRIGEAKLGGGPILHCGPTYNRALLSMVQKTAKTAKLKTQFQPEGRGTGTDAYAIQMTRGGVAAALFSVPSRYMHSPVEVISLADANNTARLIAQVLLSLSGKEPFVHM